MRTTMRLFVSKTNHTFADITQTTQKLISNSESSNFVLDILIYNKNEADGPLPMLSIENQTNNNNNNNNKSMLQIKTSICSTISPTIRGDHHALLFVVNLNEETAFNELPAQFKKFQEAVGNNCILILIGNTTKNSNVPDKRVTQFLNDNPRIHAYIQDNAEENLDQIRIAAAQAIHQKIAHKTTLESQNDVTQPETMKMLSQTELNEIKEALDLCLNRRNGSKYLHIYQNKTVPTTFYVTLSSVYNSDTKTVTLSLEELNKVNISNLDAIDEYSLIVLGKLFIGLSLNLELDKFINHIYDVAKVQNGLDYYFSTRLRKLDRSPRRIKLSKTHDNNFNVYFVENSENIFQLSQADFIKLRFFAGSGTLIEKYGKNLLTKIESTVLNFAPHGQSHTGNNNPDEQDTTHNQNNSFCKF